MPAIARAAAAEIVLAIPYLSHYQGQPTQNSDRGPTSVAMILQYSYGPPNSVFLGDYITQVRTAMGNTSGGDTGFSDFENALSYYGLSYSEISNDLSPQLSAQMQVMQQTIAAG